MSKQDLKTLRKILVVVIIIRSIPYLLKINDDLFIVFFDAVVLIINIMVLASITRQTKVSQEQLSLMTKNDILNQTANLMFKTVHDSSNYIEIELHNIGKGVAFNINIEAYKGNTKKKFEVLKLLVGERFKNPLYDTNSRLFDFQDEFLYYHEFIVLNIFKIGTVSKIRLMVSYSDASSKEMHQFEHIINRKITKK